MSPETNSIICDLAYYFAHFSPSLVATFNFSFNALFEINRKRRWFCLYERQPELYFWHKQQSFCSIVLLAQLSIGE